MKQEILDAIEEYKQGKLSLAKVAGKYQIDRTHLSNLLKKEGITIVNKQNIPRINESVFDSIDTEESAYWLGFLFADGNVSSNNYKIDLSLSSNDIEHLNKYKSFLQYQKNLKIEDTNFSNSKRVRLVYSSKHIHNTLCNYGCIPQKSLILKFPRIDIFKDKNLIKHFIRGYVDGDGCLTFTNKLHTIPNITILGTKEFLTSILDYLPVKTKILKRKNVFILNFSRKKAYKLAVYLYKDCKLYLDRKYLRYKEYCRLYQE